MNSSNISTNPLCLKLLASLGLSDGVLEDTVISPKSELLLARSSSHQVEDGADKRLLIIVEVNARGSLDVGALELEVALDGQYRVPPNELSYSPVDMLERRCRGTEVLAVQV